MINYTNDIFNIENNLPKAIREKLVTAAIISVFELIVLFVIFTNTLSYFGATILYSLLISLFFIFFYFIIGRTYNIPKKGSELLFLSLPVFIKAYLLSFGTMFLLFKSEINEMFYSYHGLWPAERGFVDPRFTVLEKIKLINELILDSNILMITCILIFSFFLFLGVFPLIISSVALKNTNVFRKINFDNTAEQLAIFSSIQHELGNKIPATKQEIKYLFDMFEKRSYRGEGLRILDKVRNPLPGEEPYSIDSVKDLIVRSLNKLDYSLNVIQQLGDVLKADPTKLSLETVGLVEYLNAEIPKYSTGLAQISIDIKGDLDQFVEIDKIQMGFLLNNLISNAIRHGISDENEILAIQFQVQTIGNYVLLKIGNNGLPMDRSITYEKFITPFFHFGNSGNSGLGGYIVNTILKNHDASFTLNSNVSGDDEFKTVFDLKFRKPIKK